MRRPTTGQLLLGFAVGLAAHVLHQTDTSRPLDRLAYDLTTVLASRILSDASSLREREVVIVGIDRAALASYHGPGDPRLRKPLAQALQVLRGLEPGAIAIDVLMTDPGPPELDLALARAIGSYPKGRVVLASRLVRASDGRTRGESTPIPAFLAAGAATGFVDVPEESDSVVRMLGLARHIDPSATTTGAPAGRVLVTHLALAGACALRGWPAPARTDLGWEARSPDGAVLYRIPTERGQGISLAPYRRLPGDLASLPLSRLLDPTASREQLAQIVRGKLVVLGATYLDCKDECKTPFTSFPGLAGLPERKRRNVLNRDFEETGNRSYGVEIVGNTAEAILAGEFVAPIDRRAVAAFLCTVGLVFCSLPGGVSIPLWSALALGVACLVTVGAPLAMSIGRFFYPFLPVVTTLLLAGVMRIWLEAVRESARKEFLQATFSRYVSREICEAILANPDLMRLPGRRVEVTVLFVDLREFTSRAEALEPTRVLELIDRFLQAMASAVIENGGVVNKFLGDGLMAFWGAPLPSPDHARRACQAGFAMLDRLARLNEELGPTGIDRLAIGIGINSGPAVIGTVGYEERLEYTLLGDVVNLAARIQELTKAYPTPILVGEATRQALAGRIECRLIDRVRVRGRHVETPIHEPLRPDANETRKGSSRGPEGCATPGAEGTSRSP